MSKDIPRPSPGAVPLRALRQGLADAFSRDPKQLTPQDLHHIVWGIRPGQYSDLGAFLYYLPTLAQLYYDEDDSLDSEAFECTLLEWMDSLGPLERRLITQIVLRRWRRHAGRWDLQAPFLLFWCEDVEPLRDDFVVAQCQPKAIRSREEENLHLLAALREGVSSALNPLEFLWSSLFFRSNVSVFGQITSARGENILHFLHEVGWQ